MQKHLYIFHQQKKKELKQNIMWKTMIVEFNGITVLIKRKLAFETYLTTWFSESEMGVRERTYWKIN